MTKHLALVTFVFLFAISAKSQNPSDFLPDKPGKWSYSSNIKTPGAEVVAFNKNLAIVAEWFHRNVPLLSNPKGFDLNAWAYGKWDHNYKLKKSSYSLRAEIDFGFELFLSKGGKWIVEPPHYSFDINDTETGHGTNFGGYEGYRTQVDDPKLEQALNDATLKISEYFCVFEPEKEIAPGIRLYKDGSLVVFNPDRPDYWIPVTVKEVMQAKMNYWKIKPGDKEVYNYFETAYNKMSEDELNSTAYNSSEDAIIDVGAKPYGLQIMRFNPEYWDRSRPSSDIQFMTFYYPQTTVDQMDESYRNNGNPDYASLLANQLNWSKIAGLVLNGY